MILLCGYGVNRPVPAVVCIFRDGHRNRGRAVTFGRLEATTT